MFPSKRQLEDGENRGNAMVSQRAGSQRGSPALWSDGGLRFTAPSRRKHAAEMRHVASAGASGGRLHNARVARTDIFGRFQCAWEASLWRDGSDTDRVHSAARRAALVSMKKNIYIDI